MLAAGQIRRDKAHYLVHHVLVHHVLTVDTRQDPSRNVDWELGVRINDPWAQRRIKSQIREAIWRQFAEAGIEIAFPQLDLHFDAPFESLTASATQNLDRRPAPPLNLPRK